MSIDRRLRQGIVIALALAALAGVAFDALQPLRSVAVLPFVMIGPGLALTGLLRLSDPVLELTLVVALSFAVQTLVAMVAVYGGLWSPELVLVVCMAIVFGALIAGRGGASTVA